MNRPTYLWTLFFAFQGIVFALCWFFQVQGAPDDLWLIALAHIPVVMVIAFLEQLAASKDEIRHITSCDTDTYFNPKELT